MRDLFDDHLAPDFADVHVLFLHVHAGQAIQMAKKLVRTPDDTKGLKLRVPGPTGNAVVEAMGATPVTMPVPDLPQALTTNAVDGALIPWEIIPPLQLYESTQYQIEGPDKNRFGTTTFQVSMNKARWDALPDDLKEVFDEHSGEDWLREVAAIWRASDDFGIALAVENGNEHIVLTEEEMGAFNTALAPVVDRWVEEQTGNFDAAALVKSARDALAARSLERRAKSEGGARASPSPTRTVFGALIVKVVRWWALAGGMLTLGLALMTAASAVSNITTGRPFAADHELVKHVIAVAIFMFLPYCQITGVERHRRHLHRGHERARQAGDERACRRFSPSPSRCCCWCR